MGRNVRFRLRGILTAASAAAMSLAGLALVGPVVAAHAVQRVPSGVSLGLVASPGGALRVMARSRYLAVAGDAHALTLRSEVAYPDGTISSRWTDSGGSGFVYAGPPGATVQVISATSVRTGTATRVSYRIGVIAPALDKGTVRPRSTESVYAEAIRAGLAPVAARFASVKVHRQGTLQPDYVDHGGNPYQAWCVHPLVNGYNEVTGCNGRWILYASGQDWWVSDDMWVYVPTASPSWISNTSALTEMWYGGGNVIYHHVPTTSSGTGCYSWSASDTFFGFGVVANETTCDGQSSPLVASNRSGQAWSGNTSSEIYLENIDEVHSPPSASIGNSEMEIGVSGAYSTCRAGNSSC